MNEYAVRRTGQADNVDQRFYVEKDGMLVSPWHDIPLYANKDNRILNMVVEIPRWTNIKFEVCSD
jgi:inorganic pyrophosphatase